MDAVEAIQGAEVEALVVDSVGVMDLAEAKGTEEQIGNLIGGVMSLTKTKMHCPNCKRPFDHERYDGLVGIRMMIDHVAGCCGINTVKAYKRLRAQALKYKTPK